MALCMNLSKVRAYNSTSRQSSPLHSTTEEFVQNVQTQNYFDCTTCNMALAFLIVTRFTQVLVYESLNTCSELTLLLFNICVKWVSLRSQINM